MLEHSYLVAFAKGFAITQAVEIPVVWYLLSRNFQRVGGNAKGSRIIAGAFFANMATLPYLWYVYPEFLGFAGTVAVGEITALLAEALFYHYLRGIPPGGPYRLSGSQRLFGTGGSDSDAPV